MSNKRNCLLWILVLINSVNITIINAIEFNFQGNLPIHQAIKDGDINNFKKLIQDKQNINAYNEWGDTPLLVATRNHKSEMANLLIDAGADINAQNRRDGQTALHVAADHYGSEAIMNLLLSKGADKNIKDNDGLTSDDILKEKQQDQELKVKEQEVESQKGKINRIKAEIDSL